MEEHFMWYGDFDAVMKNHWVEPPWNMWEVRESPDHPS